MRGASFFAFDFLLFWGIGISPIAHVTATAVGREDAFEKQRRKSRGLAVLVGAVGAIVLLKGLLREAVEGECGCGAFETRGGDTPGAMGAAPAGEVIPLDPDQAFVHTSLPFACVWDSSSGATGGTTSIERARKVNSCPSPRVISHRVCERPSNQGASPASDRSRRVGVRVPGPAWPTAQFSTVKGGMSREVGRGFFLRFWSRILRVVVAKKPEGVGLFGHL